MSINFNISNGITKEANQGIAVLPKDVITNIISFCDPQTEMVAASLVCHKWNAISIPEACIYQLQRKEYLHVEEVFLYQNRLGDKFDDWDCVFKHCRGLKELECSSVFRYRVSGAEQVEIISIIQSVSKHCLDLTRINFAHCFAVGDETLAALAQYLPTLTHVNLGACRYSEDGIEMLVKGCPNLISINMFENGIGDEAIMHIANHCPMLEKLNLFSTHGYADGKPITDASILLLSSKCTALAQLILSDAQITNNSLQSLAKHCKNLSYFFYFNCPLLKKRGLNALKWQLSKLTISNNITDSKMIRFV